VPFSHAGIDPSGIGHLVAAALAVLVLSGLVLQTFLEVLNNLAVLAVQCLWLVALGLTIGYAVWRSRWS